MNKDILRMQMLSGVITESEYKAKLEEIEENKKLTTKAVREYWGEASNTDNPVSHPYGVTYEIYEYEGDTLGKLVDTAPYVDLFTTKEQAEGYINEFNSNSLEERNLEDQQFNWDMLYDENKEYRHNENKSKLEEIGMFNDPIGYEKSEPNPKDEIFTKKYKGNGMYVIYKNGKEVKTIEGEGNANAWINDEKKKLKENKETLNENFVGMGMVGNIFDREKTDYELAFEHFTKGSLSENETEVNEYDDFNTESSSAFFSQLANKLKTFLKNEINLSDLEIDGVKIPEEETLEDAVNGMMEVLGVVMKGKAYTIGEKDVAPGYLDRLK